MPDAAIAPDHPHRRPDRPDRGRRLAAADGSHVRPAGPALRASAGAPRRASSPARRSPPPTSRRSTRCCSPTTTTATTSTPPAGRCSRPRTSWSPPRRARGGSAARRAAWSRGRARASRRPGGRRSRSPPRPAGTDRRSATRSSATWSGSRCAGTARSTASSGSRATRCSTTACARSPSGSQVGTALLHLGGVRFPVTGPLRYTMTARDAVELLRPRPRRTPRSRSTTRAGSTSSEGREAIERELATAPDDVRASIRGCRSAPRSRSRHERA